MSSFSRKQQLNIVVASFRVSPDATSCPSVFILLLARAPHLQELSLCRRQGVLSPLRHAFWDPNFHHPNPTTTKVEAVTKAESNKPRIAPVPDAAASLWLPLNDFVYQFNSCAIPQTTLFIPSAFFSPHSCSIRYSVDICLQISTQSKE